MTKRNLRKSDSGSFATGIPSDVVALNILIRIVGLKLKGLIVNGKVIFAVFIAVLIGVGFYFGYLRHEPRCYEAIDKEITSIDNTKIDKKVNSKLKIKSLTKESYLNVNNDIMYQLNKFCIKYNYPTYEQTFRSI